jgi:putative transmembrane protein PGPGW
VNLRELLEATPGRRFTERYRQRRHAGAAWRKPLSMIAGAMLILLGVLLTLTPGPGIVVLFFGAALIATESERAARALDQLELRLRQAWRKLKRRASRPSGPA